MKNKSPMFNLNKKYKTPLNVEDGLIVKAFRSLGSDYSKFKVQQQRIKSGSAKDPKLEKTPTKAPEFSTGGYDKAAADAKLKTSLNKFVEPTALKPTTITTPPKPSAPKPRAKVNSVTVKAEGAKSSNLAKVTASSEAKVKAKEFTSSKENRRLAKKADKASGMSRQEIRLNKTKRKAESAKSKSIDAIGKVKKDSGSNAANQTTAKSQRTKAKRLENRATRIEGRIERKKSRQDQKNKVKSNK